MLLLLGCDRTNDCRSCLDRHRAVPAVVKHMHEECTGMQGIHAILSACTLCQVVWYQACCLITQAFFGSGLAGAGV